MRGLIIKGLARHGFEVRRHSAARRQQILAKHGIDLVLDVGAAKGAYGQQLRQFGYAGRILSFEPLQAAYSQLEAATEGDPRWTTRRVAVGSKPGNAEINVATNSDSSSLLPMLEAHQQAAPSITYAATETIEVARLDDLALDDVLTASGAFLKIDVQGFEREVLSGAPKIVESVRGLQLELSFVPLYEGGMLVYEALTWAYDHGFSLVGAEQGFSAPGGEILQMDGVFAR
jgi:FkbM family methyltransferase